MCDVLYMVASTVTLQNENATRHPCQMTQQSCTWEQIGDDASKQWQVMRQELGHVDVPQRTQQQHFLVVI